MKVDVLQVGEATFSRWSWWSNWIDIVLFDCNSTPFLLQMQISRINRKRFKAIRVTGTFFYRQSTCAAIGDLMPMGRAIEQ